MVYEIELNMRQPSLFVGIVEAGDLAPALHGLALAGVRASVGKPGRATLLLGSGSICEQPRLRLLQHVHVAAVVGQHRASGLDVAHASQLQLEVDLVTLSLGLQLRDLATQRLHRLGVPGGLCHLLLQFSDAAVALGEGHLPVHAAHLRLLLRCLLLPVVLRGFRDFLCLAAMCITCHAGHLPHVVADKTVQPLNLLQG